MDKFIILIFSLLILNTCYGQYNFDLYGTNTKYKGNVKEVTAEYYKPVFEKETIVKYSLESSPAMYRVKFNEEGQMLSREEFDITCGMESKCITNKITYNYENGRLINKERIGEFDRRETYRYSRDSIICYSIGKYRKIKTIKYKIGNKEIEEFPKFHKKQKTKITYFNDKGFPVKFEKYWLEELTESKEYFYKDTTCNLITNVTTVYQDTQKELQKNISYNKNGNISVWESYNNKGELNYKLTFKYKYDEIGNWVEMKVFNTNDRLIDKVIKKFNYR